MTNPFSPCGDTLAAPGLVGMVDDIHPCLTPSDQLRVYMYTSRVLASLPYRRHSGSMAIFRYNGGPVKHDPSLEPVSPSEDMVDAWDEVVRQNGETEVRDITDGLDDDDNDEDEPEPTFPVRGSIWDRLFAGSIDPPTEHEPFSRWSNTVIHEDGYMPELDHLKDSAPLAHNYKNPDPQELDRFLRTKPARPNYLREPKIWRPR